MNFPGNTFCSFLLEMSTSTKVMNLKFGRQNWKKKGGAIHRSEYIRKHFLKTPRDNVNDKLHPSKLFPNFRFISCQKVYK